MIEAVYGIDSEELLISADDARAVGARYAEKYQSGEPYHHICIDNFLPETILEKVCSDLKLLPEAEASFARAQENLKS